MNFSLHKRSANYFFLFLFFLSVVGFFRCVPIEDLVAPTVGEFTLQEQYNVSDSIILTAILVDNFGISKYTIDIEAVDGAGLWSYNSTDSVKARLLNLKDTIIIPSENFVIGNYELTLTVFDASGKSKIRTKNFSVEGDISKPTFPTFDVLLPTIEQINGNYAACRLQRVPLGGLVRDNIGLSSITAQFEGFTTIVRRNPNGLSSVDLSSLFGNELVFPNVANNEPLILILTAIDTENNSSSVRIPFIMNCDNQSPIIERIDTNIKSNITQNGDIINVIQGQALSITGGLIRDRLGELDSLIIYLEDKSERETVIVPLFSEAISGESYTIDNDIPIFSFRSTPRIGKIYYNLKVKAIDTVGNESNIREIKLFIAPNEPPSIIPSIIEVDGINVSTPLPFNVNNPIPVSRGSTVRLYGKILDDLEIQEYEIKWGKINEEILILEGTANNFIYDNTTVGIINVSSNANRLDIYTLTIFAKDILGVENKVTYYFRVQ